MAITHATALRNAIADAVDDYINTTGATDAQGDLVIIESAGPTDLIEFVLSNPAFGAAASGQISLAGLPKSATAAATGTANLFEVRDRNNSMAYTGTVTGTGGGGDIEIDNTSVNSGQDADLTAHSYTAPA